MAKVACTPEAVTFSSFLHGGVQGFDAAAAKWRPHGCVLGQQRTVRSRFIPAPGNAEHVPQVAFCRVHHTGCVFGYASLPRRLCPTKVDASDSAPLMLTRWAMR